MVSSKLIVLTVFCPYVILHNIKSNKSDEFGAYVSVWDQLELCRGPKLLNVTKLNSALVEKQGSYFWMLNMTYLKTTKINEIRVQVFNRNGNHRKILWRNTLTNPCNNYVLKTIIQEYVPTEKSCSLEKGDYYFQANLTDMTYKFFGKSFVYGNYQLKVIVLSKDATVLCLLASIRYLKQK